MVITANVQHFLVHLSLKDAYIALGWNSNDTGFHNHKLRPSTWRRSPWDLVGVEELVQLQGPSSSRMGS